MADNLPYFKTYPGDLRKDLGYQSLSYHARGVWLELRCMMHNSAHRGKMVQPDGKPVSDDTIARLLGLALHDSKKTLQGLIDSGVAQRCPESGALIDPKMVHEEWLRQIRRQSGSQGGNPVLLNQNGYLPTKPKDNQNSEYEIEHESSHLSLVGESEGKKPRAMAVLVLTHLNEKAGRNYRQLDEYLKPIEARLESVQWDVEGVKQMIDRQVALWKGDVAMEKYLNPTTLFRASKFPVYYDDRSRPVVVQQQRANPAQQRREERAQREFPQTVKAKVLNDD